MKKILIKVVPEKSKGIILAQSLLICASILCLVLAGGIILKEFL